MREIVHLQAGQCGNQIGAKVRSDFLNNFRTQVMSSSILMPREHFLINMRIYCLFD